MKDKVDNSNFTWLKMTAHTAKCAGTPGGVGTGSRSSQPTTSIALMFMQRKTELFWFYSEAFDSGAECLLAAFQHRTSGSGIR